MRYHFVPSMNRPNLDPIGAAAAALNTLAETWSPEMSDADLRLGTEAIFDLLIVDVLGKAWHSLGFPDEPGLMANDLGAGADTWVPPTDPPIQITASFAGPRTLMSVSRFLKSACVVWDGVEMSRARVIGLAELTSVGVHCSPEFEQAMCQRREPFEALLEIGMSLLTSEDVRKLRDRLASCD